MKEKIKPVPLAVTDDGEWSSRPEDIPSVAVPPSDKWDKSGCDCNPESTTASAMLEEIKETNRAVIQTHLANFPAININIGHSSNSVEDTYKRQEKWLSELRKLLD